MFSVNKLIAEIKNHPSLWDYDDKNYKNKRVKFHEWNEIGESVIEKWPILNAHKRKETVRCLQKKWKNVRDYYKKQHKGNEGVEEESNDSTLKRRKYIFYDKLRFLDKTLKDKPVKPLEAEIVHVSHDLQLNIKEEKLDIAEEEEAEDDEEEYPRQQLEGLIPMTILNCAKLSTSFQSRQNYSPIETDKEHFVLAADETANKSSPLSKEQEGIPSNSRDDYNISLTKVCERCKNIEQIDENKHFLFSLLPEMKMLSGPQSIDFKMGILNELKKVKYSNRY